MDLRNDFGEQMHLDDDTTLKELVDMGMLVVLGDTSDPMDICWVQVQEESSE